MPGSDSKSIYSLIGIAGALVGERISDVLGFDFLSVGLTFGIIPGAAFLSLAGGSFGRRKRMVVTTQHQLIDHKRGSNTLSL